jgi:hypothetical protein
MPIPKPNSGEEEQDFINRCAGDDLMNEEFPDSEQRVAACHASWRAARPISASAGRAFILTLSTEPALAVGGLKLNDGVPSQHFRKEVIRVGSYVKDDEGIEFEVTPKLLKHWIATFKEMKADGIEVPIPAGHTDEPEKNHGFVRDVFAEGESLFNIMELIGKDSIDLAKRNHVSIYCPPELINPKKMAGGKRKIYKRPIVHVALTPKPVIPGLGPWEAVAASLTLKVKGEDMNWEEIRKGLGIEGEMTDETAPKLLLAHFKGLGEKHGELQLAFDELKKTNSNGDKNGEKGKGETTPPATKPDPMLIKLSSENRLNKLNALVEAARITPAVRDKLEEQYASEKSLTLSLSRGGDNFDELVSALAENDPVELAEKSGPQTLALSMQVEGGKNPLVEDAKRRADEAKG